MARIRTIKPELFVSETLAMVSLAAERTFTGLLTQADDRGRVRYNAAVLNGALWPLRPEHTVQDFASEVDALVEVGALCRYTADDKVYLHFPTWTSHQKISHPSTRVNGPACPTHTEDAPGYSDEETRNSGSFPESSGETPQGKGSGKGKGKERDKPASRSATMRGRSRVMKRDAPEAPTSEPASTPIKTSDVNDVVAGFSESVSGMIDPVKVRAVARKALKAGYPPIDITGALQRAHQDGRPLTATVVHQYLEGYPRRNGTGKAIHYAADRERKSDEYQEDL